MLVYRSVHLRFYGVSFLWPRTELSILDIVVHSCRTVIHSLTADDRLGIVTYSDAACVAWENYLHVPGICWCRLSPVAVLFKILRHLWVFQKGMWWSRVAVAMSRDLGSTVPAGDRFTSRKFILECKQRSGWTFQRDSSSCWGKQFGCEFLCANLVWDINEI